MLAQVCNVALFISFKIAFTLAFIIRERIPFTSLGSLFRSFAVCLRIRRVIAILLPRGISEYYWQTDANVFFTERTEIIPI